MAYLRFLRAVPHIEVPQSSPRWTAIWKDIVVRLPWQLAPLRAQLRASLLDRGIETRAYFSPALHQCAMMDGANEDLVVTEDLAARVLCLPFFETITVAQMRYVADTLHRELQRLSIQTGLKATGAIGPFRKMQRRLA
jgi:dTDP-4-amino-4,6-dideoxygalactose transaminase